MIKKIVKFLAFLLIGLITIGVIAYYIIDEPLPEGQTGTEAEQLANEMLSVLNKEAYDSLELIEFSFRNAHHYKWKRAENRVVVSWEEQEVDLDLNKPVKAYNLLEFKAYQYFINDSFWLVAPFKIRDEGVVRSKIDLPMGRGLLVSYSSGGLTPGDSYLWIIDDQGFPVAWKIWTSNVPIGGLEFTWDGWVNMDDAWFSTLHESSILDIPVTVSSAR